MYSIQDILKQPLTEDMLIDAGYLDNSPQSIYSAMGVPESYGPQLPDIRAVSGKIQEVLGAKEPNQAGMIGEILTKRFQPDTSWDDVAKGAVSTLYAGKPVSGQDVANERLASHLDRMNALAKYEYYNARAASPGGGSSVYAQRMAELNADPNTVKLPLGLKMQIASGKVGTNLTFDPVTGQVSDMGGAAGGLGNLAYGEEMGTQNARVQTARDLAVQKGMGEADTAAQIAIQTEIGKATGQAQGGIAKKEVNAPQILGLVSEAEKLLPQSTGSAIGRIAKYGGQQLGVSTDASRADKQLSVIAAALTSNVPRMEGPQSDYDVALYQQAAGDVANTSIPYKDRLAALQTIKALQQKYIGQAPLGAPVQVTTPEEAMNLPSGTQFITPDGRVKVRP